MKRLPHTAAVLACLAFAACEAETDGPLVPPELAVARGMLAADSVTDDDDDLVCEWGPVEGQEGEWEVTCYREESTGEAEGDDVCRCWYWVTYRCRRGGTDCVKIKEDFLGCDPNCSGGTDCDDTQTEIYEEYNSNNPHGGHGQSPQQEPANCKTIEHHASGHQMATNFTWGELNGYFQDGNPHRGNGGGWGWIQSALPSGLQTLRNDWAADSLGGVYGAAIPVSSGYRCPHGNASIPGAVSTSWHMSGLAADISVRSIAQRHPDWGSFDTDEKKDAKYKEVWNKLDALSEDVNKSNIESWNNYPDRHFHIRF